jgi:hypothetical protein|tara:strand:+ start:68 stop:418 length:351 start_codon:yes stop_codon:yes gene_type:complete
MKCLLEVKTNPVAGLRLVFLLWLLGSSASLNAQAVLSGTQIGTIQDMQRSEGIFVISNRNYGFDEELTRVFYDGGEVGPDFLNEGLVVRFVVSRNGLIVRIEVLGPIANIMALEPS